CHDPVKHDKYGLPWGHRRPLIEGYGRGELEVHVHGRSRHRGVLHDWCAVFNRADSWPVELADNQPPDIELTYACDTGDARWNAVLVRVVEGMQDRKRFDFPSVVRLQPLQECIEVRRHSFLWPDFLGQTT